MLAEVPDCDSGVVVVRITNLLLLLVLFQLCARQRPDDYDGRESSGVHAGFDFTPARPSRRHPGGHGSILAPRRGFRSPETCLFRILGRPSYQYSRQTCRLKRSSSGGGEEAATGASPAGLTGGASGVGAEEEAESELSWRRLSTCRVSVSWSLSTVPDEMRGESSASSKLSGSEDDGTGGGGGGVGVVEGLLRLWLKLS